MAATAPSARRRRASIATRSSTPIVLLERDGPEGLSMRVDADSGLDALVAAL